MFSVMGAFAPWLSVGLVPGAVLSPLLFGHFSTRTLRTALARAVALISPSVLRARLKAVRTVDVSAEFSAVKIPVLYLRASQDRLVPAEASAAVAELNPQTRVVEVQGPHLLLQAAPAEAAEAVRAFVREIQD
jgi:pimeloyl-ACP methyl ester carboxylesterase